MKLHLPKALLSAIAAALVTPAAYAYTLRTGDKNQLSENQEINDTQTLEGDVTVNGKGSYAGHEAGHDLSLVENANVTIDGNLYIVSQCHLKINNGAALTTTGMLSFGHDNSSYPGDLEMTGGQLKVSKIRFHNNNANRVSITGGILIITGDEAIYDEKGAKLSTLTIGGEDTTYVTLKTGSENDVTFDYSKLQLGNVTIAADNARTITITNATLNGAITNEAGADKLQLGDLTIAADTQEEITITNATLGGAITNEAGADKLILSGNIDLLSGSEYITVSNGDYYSDETADVSSNNGYFRADYTANFGTDLTLRDVHNLTYEGRTLTPNENGYYTVRFTDTSTYHVRVGIVDELSDNETLKYSIEGGTLQAAGDISNNRLSYTSGSLEVSQGHSLTIDTDKDDVAALILNTTGAGNIEINIPTVTLTGDKAMQITGDLIVKGSSTLELAKSTDATKKTTVNFSSLNSLILDNSTLKANTDAANQVAYRQFTLGTLAVAGESEIAIDGNTPYHGNVTISNLINGMGTGARTLTLSSNAKIDTRSIFDLNGAELNDGESLFEGTIKVEYKRDRATGKTALNLKHSTAASKAVIELDVSSSHGSVALGIAAEEVTVKGITGDKKTNTNLYILSGEQTKEVATDFAGDGTNRTLIIDTGDDGHYSTTATLGDHLNLTKKGEGSQTFAGATPDAIDTVKVEGGELAFSNLNALSITQLTVNSNAKLTFTTEGESAVNFGFLGGSGNLVFNGGGNGASTLNMSLAMIFEGNIIVNNEKSGGSDGGGKTILKLTNALSSVGDVFKSLTLSNSGTDSNSLGGIVQILNMVDNWDPTGKRRQTTVKSLTVKGLGTIETVHAEEGGDDYNATITINALSGTDAVLNLRSGSRTSNRTVFELGTADAVQSLAAGETPDTGKSPYTGTIKVVANAVTDDEARRVGLVINNDEIAKGAIIELTETSAGTSNQVDLAINSDNVNVRGIQTTTAGGSSFSSTIVSGSLEANDTEVSSSSDTERTLTINTKSGDNFVANAAIKGNLNLVKKGEGKQTFSGDMSAFDKAVSVEGGELAFSNAVVLEITDLTVKRGATLTIGSPVQTFAANAAQVTGVNATGTVLLEGGSTINGGLNLTGTQTLEINDIGNGPITLKGALVLPTGGNITLDGNILTTLAWLGKDHELEVFTGVTSLTLGDTNYTGVTDLKNYFNFTGLEAGSYSLGYTGAEGGGIVYIQKNVPEPTTATLSLLALAALAARRRRKN